jgi:hypothetical protein
MGQSQKLPYCCTKTCEAKGEAKPRPYEIAEVDADNVGRLLEQWAAVPGVVLEGAGSRGGEASEGDPGKSQPFDAVEFEAPPLPGVEGEEDLESLESWTVESALAKLRLKLEQLDVPHSGSTDCCKLVFHDKDGSEHTVHVEFQPLGLVFETSLPLIVARHKFDSYGAALGIEVGWVLKEINGRDVTDVNSADQALELLSIELSELPFDDPQHACTIVFDAFGKDETVRVRYKPLGLQFSIELPLKVASVTHDGCGELLGIQRGWIFKSINGVDLSSVNSLHQSLSSLAHQINGLPDFPYAACNGEVL